MITQIIKLIMNFIKIMKLIIQIILKLKIKEKKKRN